uniref:Uncharacterized protein n=1 Tax=Oryza brachyantha TaxID=4533 RepID=J3MSS5_ORYBR
IWPDYILATCCCRYLLNDKNMQEPNRNSLSSTERREEKAQHFYSHQHTKFMKLN